MKKLLLTLFVITLSFNSYSEVLTSKDYLPNDNTSILEKLRSIKKNINFHDFLLNGHKVCQEIGKIYLTPDFDDLSNVECVNISEGGKDIRSQKPKFVDFIHGYSNGILTGNMTRTISGSSPTYHGPSDLCNEKFAGSRAMTYEDVKSVFIYLPRNSVDKYKFHMTGSSDNLGADVTMSNIRLAGGIATSLDNEMYLQSGELVGSATTSGNFGSCKNWTSSSASDHGLVLNGDGSFTTLPCDQQAFIACINN